MPRKLRQLRAELQHAGWRVDRQSGTSHQIWRHPLILDLEVNLAGQDGKDAKPYQERDVREAVRRADEARRRSQEP
ncbi:MAG: type II toxin-antitoxin system HicA family toxin [Ktedonobacterales bacterium]